MGGLRRICKLYGGMTVSDGKQTIKYVWDYAADQPVPEKEMRLGSERWKASERAKRALSSHDRETPAPQAHTAGDRRDG